MVNASGALLTTQLLPIDKTIRLYRRLSFYERVNLNNKRVDSGNKCANEYYNFQQLNIQSYLAENTYSLHCTHIYN